MLIDAHNHLHDDRITPHREAVFGALRDIGLRAAVVNGTEEADWPAVTALADAQAWVIPSYGLHPWFVSRRSPRWFDTLTACIDAEAARGRPTAIGEIGLDRWKKPFDLADQESVFVAQLELAAARDLPVTIHCLEAWGALDTLLHRHHVPARGFLIHAYGGPLEMVGRFAARGAFFSFNGYFLHQRKQARRHVFRHIPADRLLVETDAPAMPPPPGLCRHSLPPAPDGAPLNHPASLADTYRALATLRDTPVDSLIATIADNFHRLFGEAIATPARP